MKPSPSKISALWILACSAMLALSACGPGICVASGTGVCLADASAVIELNLTGKWQQIDSEWSRAFGATGYLLVRNEGSAVTWTPVNGQSYSVGQTVGETHTIVAFGTWTTASDTPLTNGTNYYYQIFSYNSGYEFTAGATATIAAGINCPSNFLLISPNTDVGSDAFCIAKYEMKNDGSDNAVSQIAGTPWASISREDGGGTPVGPGAVTRCQNMGAGFDLISNAQWQAVARDIELAQVGANFLNWSNGTTAGANYINRGHADNSPANALAASTDGDPCFGTGNASCADNTNAHFSQKRTHTLSTGDIIWDFGANVSEWVKLDIAAGPPYEGSNGYVSAQPWTSGLNHPEMWGPSGNYTAKSTGELGGFGFAVMAASAGGVLRGGYWSGTLLSGIFYSNLTVNPIDSGPVVGFRCVYAP